MSEPVENIIQKNIKKKLQKLIKTDKNLKNALLLIHSDKLQIHWKFAVGNTGDQQVFSEDNPYHIASIGKTFTSVIVSKLFEKGKIKFEDPISKYLSLEVLKDLFVYQGKDYAKDVLVKQLLNHTSGIADYYEDRPYKGKSMKEILVEKPGRFWKPEDLMAYTRDNQKAYCLPGKKFHYSDTGYILLGKIIENITEKPFHENLHTEIFDPLEMGNSYFLFYSEPKQKSTLTMAETFLGKQEVSTYKSFSADWAGGGIVSTTEDLLIFQKALVNNLLIKKETFDLGNRELGKFGFGMDYGYGILHLNIGKMTFIFPQKLNMWGNFGSFAEYMFYNPYHDVYIIGSFNHSNYVVKQVFFLIDIIRKVSKLCR